MFPTDAQTVQAVRTTAGITHLLPNAQYTILGIGIDRESSTGEVQIFCGSTQIIHLYGADLPYTSMQYNCNNFIDFITPTNADTNVLLTYVERNLNATLTPTPSATPSATISAQLVFSPYQQSMLSGTFLILLLVLFFVSINFGRSLFK